MKRKLEDKCFLCCVSSCEEKCEDCGLAFCSPTHLGVHKQTGKCSPWMVETRPGVGRVVLAARDIQPFELVMRDVDLLGRVMVDAKACVLCGGRKEDSELRKCDCGFEKCKTECSGDQQHLGECSSLQTLNIQNKTLKDKNKILMSLGFWRMIKLEHYHSEKWKSLMNLTSHREIRNKSKRFQKSVKFLHDKLNLIGIHVDEDVLPTLQGILETNSHSFNKNIHHIFGNFSLISHSCIPNCEHLLAGEQAIVRAKVKIKKGEEITIRYSDLSLHREILLEEMETSWLFKCSCPRCSDYSELGTEASSFNCDKCGKGFVRMHEDNICCNICDKTMTYIQFVVQAHRLRDMELSCESREDIPKVIEKIEKNGGHALYHSVIQLKIRFMESTTDKMDNNTSHLVMEYSKDVTRFMEVLNPGVSRLRGRLLSCIRMAESCVKDDQTSCVENKDNNRKNRLLEQKMMSGYFKC